MTEVLIQNSSLPFDPDSPPDLRRLCFRMAKALNWPADLPTPLRPGFVLSAGSEEAWLRIVRIAELVDVAVAMLAMDDRAKSRRVNLYQEVYGKEAACPARST